MTKYLINNVETTKEDFFERLEEQVQLKAQDNVDKIVDLESDISDSLEMFGDYTINDIHFKLVEETERYYIHLYDYDNGVAIFESEFFETKRQALEKIKDITFNIDSYRLSLELMGGRFINEELQETYLIKVIRKGR